MNTVHMKYIVATGAASQSSTQAIASLERAVLDELKKGAQLVGGVSVIYVSGVGYQCFQSVVHQSSVSNSN